MKETLERVDGALVHLIDVVAAVQGDCVKLKAVTEAEALERVMQALTASKRQIRAIYPDIEKLGQA